MDASEAIQEVAAEIRSRLLPDRVITAEDLAETLLMIAERMD